MLALLVNGKLRWIVRVRFLAIDIRLGVKRNSFRSLRLERNLE